MTMNNENTNTAVAVAAQHENAQVAKQYNTQNTIRKTAEAVVDASLAQWARVLPAVCKPERFARVALSCILKNRVLGEALATTQGKASVLQAFMTCAEMGIEPDGRRAHLIAFKDNRNGGFNIQLIFDYKGIVELAYRSGVVANIHADCICEHDEFEYDIGRITRHRPDFRKPRGAAYAYYAVVHFKDGTVKSEVMTREDVERIRKRSNAVKAGKSTPWDTDYDEMAKKTVFRRLSKWIPLSPEARDAIEHEDEDYRAPQVVVASETNPPRRASASSLLGAAKTEAKAVDDDDLPYDDPIEGTAPNDAAPTFDAP
jgi:recombination protein RecT